MRESLAGLIVEDMLTIALGVILGLLGFTILWGGLIERGEQQLRRDAVLREAQARRARDREYDRAEAYQRGRRSVSDRPK